MMVFDLLLLHREVRHMLLVDVCLLVEGGALMGQVTLLIDPPRVVLELWHGG